MYNRQQRRKIEKNLGLTKEYSKKSEKEKSEIRHERIEKGKQIHAKNTQEIRDRQAEADALRFQQRINSLLKLNYTIEEATKIAEIEYEEEMQETLRKKTR